MCQLCYHVYMNWIFYALVGPILWSLVNFSDKFLLDKFFKREGGIGSLMLFSTFFAVITLPALYLFDHSIFDIPVTHTLIMIASGCMGAFAIYVYLICLFDEETSTVAPFFQLIPVFGFIFGYMLLGEVLSRVHTAASLLIIIGALVLTIERTTIKWRLIILMSLSSLIFALQRTVFKVMAIDTNFLTVSFWENVGLLVFGIIIFLFIKNTRQDFIKTLKTSSGSILGINLVSEAATVIGNISFAYAVTLAPVALVLSIEGTQPLFIFMLGIIFTLFAPHIIKEEISKGVLFKKGVATVIIVAGGILASF